MIQFNKKIWFEEMKQNPVSKSKHKISTGGWMVERPKAYFYWCQCGFENQQWKHFFVEKYNDKTNKPQQTESSIYLQPQHHNSGPCFKAFRYNRSVLLYLIKYRPTVLLYGSSCFLTWATGFPKYISMFLANNWTV